LRDSGYNERWLNDADVADAADKGGLLRVAFRCSAPGLGCFWEQPLAQASSRAEALRRDNNKKRLSPVRCAHAPGGAIRLFPLRPPRPRGSTNVHCSQTRATTNVHCGQKSLVLVARRSPRYLKVCEPLIASPSWSTRARCSCVIASRSNGRGLSIRALTKRHCTARASRSRSQHRALDTGARFC
jgi:hypothetical protein